MQKLTIRPFKAGDEAAVIKVWQACDLTRPWNNPKQDIERKLATQPELFFVGEIEGRVAATLQPRGAQEQEVRLARQRQPARVLVRIEKMLNFSNYH